MMSDKNEYTCKGVRCCCQSRLQEVLQKYFSFSSFRPGQMEASRSVLHGKDVFVRMATGSGKTLCMFLGPLAKSDKALGVVISPLNGLMEQQVQDLQKVGITAVHVGLDSTTMYEPVSIGEYRFVFMSPETVIRAPWRNIFQTVHFRKHLFLVAVDEAHCIPEWGSEFRTAFKRIGGLRALADVPFMALSASSPPSVAKDIEESLHMKSPVYITHSLDRPSIFLSYSKSRGLARDLDGLSCALKASTSAEVPKTIVFCRTKNDAAKVYSLLLKSANDKHSIDMYHSSLTQGTKRRVQDRFKSGTQLRCLSATIAFGMGIDIPDVELVVVYGIPDTMSQLYQLCGRAGRNGQQSRAHLLLTTDVQKLKDPTMKTFCSNKENCPRSKLLVVVFSSSSSPVLHCEQSHSFFGWWEIGYYQTWKTSSKEAKESSETGGGCVCDRVTAENREEEVYGGKASFSYFRGTDVVS